MFLFFHRILLIVAFIACYAIAAPVSTSAKLNCFVRKLKSENKLATNFPEFAVTNEDNECEAFLKAAEKEAYQAIAFRVRMKSNYGEHTPCIMSDLRLRSWVDDIWLKYIYQASSSMPEDEKVKKSAAIDDKIEESMIEAFIGCIYEKKFGALFDQIVSADMNSIDDTATEWKQDYCIRKLVVAKNLIDTSVYNVTLNPRNLNVDSIRCDEVLVPELAQMREMLIETLKSEDMQLKKHQVQCIANKFRDERYIGKFLAVGVLSELRITDEQKAVERKKFIHFIVEIVLSMEACSEI